jgi:hypothetical protein
MKAILNLLLVLFSLSVFSQQEIAALDINLSQGTQVLEIAGNNQKQVSLLFHGSNKTKLYTLNEQFKIADSLSVSNNNDESYAEMIGYGLSDKTYFCYLATPNNKNIFCQRFDLNKREVTVKSFRLEFEKEKLLAKITVNNVFYMVGLIKNSNLLNLYVFKNGSMDKKTIDLSSKRFLDRNNKVVNLWDIVSKETPSEASFSLQIITNTTLPSLLLNASKRKLYSSENQLIFSLDTNKKFTQTFSINLNDFSISQKVYSQPYFEDKIIAYENTQIDDAAQSSNSILHNNLWIQMRADDEVVKFSIKKPSGEEIKNLEINARKEITFRNSEIYQERGSVQSLKVMDKPDQFIKKLNGLNVSVSLQKLNNNLLLTLGGVSALESSDGAMIGGIVGGLAGAVIGAAISSNSLTNASSENNYSYKNRKVIYTYCLFDERFNHFNGEIKTTAFDALREFAEKSASKAMNTAFKMNDDLYYGVYNAENKKYLFYKFSY